MALQSLILKGGEKREGWNGEKRTEINTSLISILVVLQVQPVAAAAGSCSPATRRKEMKAVKWQHRLNLVIILFYQQALHKNIF